MRVLLMGAGSVGLVLGRALEQQKGNDVCFLLRPGRKKAFERYKLLDAKSGELRTRERPTAVELGQVRPAFDTLLLCVRADQIDAALDDVGPLAKDVRIATIAPGTDELPRVQARHPHNIVVRMKPLFMAYPDGDVTVTWFPPLVKSLIIADERSESVAFATELAAALEAGGVPARATDRQVGLDAGNDVMMPVLAAYSIAGYDGDSLRRDRDLLELTGRAVGEALLVDGAPGVAGMLARRAAGPLIKAAVASAPGLPGTFRTMWRTHVPKIEAQTRGMIDAIISRGAAGNRDTPALTELRRRMDRVNQGSP